MTRFVVAFCLSSLLLSSIGCRMCGSPYDYCIPAYIDRPDDFRSCGPLYRAGSILSGDGYGMRSMTCGDVLYVSHTGEFSSNAGNYGMTMPIVSPSIQRSSDSFESPTRQYQSPIAKPEDGYPIPSYDAPNNLIPTPTVDELLNQPRRGTTPPPMAPIGPMSPMPITPPGKPRVDTPSFEETPIEVLPFSPSDEPLLPSPFPTTTETDPPFTLEELRRLDPSIRDVQIISIEDAAAETFIY